MGEIAPGEKLYSYIQRSSTLTSQAHIRGLLVGLFGACFQFGSLGMNGAMLGLVTPTQMTHHSHLNILSVAPCAFILNTTN